MHASHTMPGGQRIGVSRQTAVHSLGRHDGSKAPILLASGDEHIRQLAAAAFTCARALRRELSASAAADVPVAGVPVAGAPVGGAPAALAAVPSALSSESEA